jgi:hypothetical protein
MLRAAKEFTAWWGSPIALGDITPELIGDYGLQTNESLGYMRNIWTIMRAADPIRYSLRTQRKINVGLGIGKLNPIHRISPDPPVQRADPVPTAINSRAAKWAASVAAVAIVVTLVNQTWELADKLVSVLR